MWRLVWDDEWDRMKADVARYQKALDAQRDATDQLIRIAEVLLARGRQLQARVTALERARQKGEEE